MDGTIFELEQKMWDASLKKDKIAFSKLVSADSVMICGGLRCSGAEYADFLCDFGILSYEIMHFETVVEQPTLVQVHYVVRTVADSEENADLAGLFHVTSTWERKEEGWKLVFNMDSRIFE